MKKFYSGAYILCTILGLSAQEVLWQIINNHYRH